MAKKVVYVPTCHSTNLLAEQLLSEQDMHEGAVVVTDHQTSGKGRTNKVWESQKGKNLTLSVILKPTFLDLELQFYLNIFTSLAVASIVSSLGGTLPKIKWPNDVLVNGNKISGILVKNILKGKKISSSIVGIGINVNQVDFSHENAVSLKAISGRNLLLEEVFSLLMQMLEKYYLMLRDSAFEQLKEEYHTILYGLNREIIFEAANTFQGVIKGIDNRGHLIVEKNGKRELFSLNEIRYVSQPV